MTYLLLQTFLLLLASYFLGAFTGCLAKRVILGRRLAEPALATETIAVERVAIEPVIAPREPRSAPPPMPPRGIERGEPRVEAGHRAPPRAALPLQPMIETGPRPERRLVSVVVDPTRFERALFGPDANEGMPRIAIVEIRPAILESPTGPPLPWPPPPKPVPVAPPVEDGVETAPAVVEKPATGGRLPLAGAAANAAAAAMAAAKAAAAAAAGVVRPRKGEAESAGDAELADREAAERATEDAKRPAQPATKAVPVAAKPAEPKPPAPKPPAPKPAPVATHKFDTSGGDDLQRIRAIDADTERRLKELGVAMFDTIAGWTAADVKRINAALDFTDRIDREQWIEQAQILAKGGETYYSRNRAAALKAAVKTETPVPVPLPVPPPSARPPASSTAKDTGPQQAKSGPPEATPTSVPVPTPVPTSAPPPAPTPALGPETTSKAPPEATTPPAAPSAAAGGGKSVSDMASAAAAAIAAASASVTRGIRPIEPISPLSKVDPNIAIPAKLQDAIKEREQQAAHAKPQSQPGTPKPAPDDATPDDLKRIRGIGVLIEKRLAAMGITRFEHIANWTSADIDRVSQVLDFKGRIEREIWVEQARILATGGDTEFSRRVDRGDDDTSGDS